MFIRYLINYFFLLLFVLLAGCEDDAQLRQKERAESYGTYRLGECIVKAEIDKQKTLSYDEYDELNRYIVFEASSQAFRNDSYPLFRTNTTRGSQHEYYFFFADLCEDKLSYANSIVKKYFLSKSKYTDTPYQVSSISEKDLPVGLSMPLGWWAGH